MKFGIMPRKLLKDFLNFLFFSLLSCLSVQAQNEQFNSKQLDSLLTEAFHAYQAKDYSNTIYFYEKALPYAALVYGTQDTNYALLESNLAFFYQNTAQYHKAKQAFINVNTIYAGIYGNTHLKYLRNFHNLAFLYELMQDYENAAVAYEEIKKSTTAQLRKELIYAETCINLAFVYESLLKDSLALINYELARKALEKNHRKKSNHFVLVCNNLGSMHKRLGHFDLAERYFMQAKEACEVVYGPKHFQYAISKNNMAGLYIEMDRLQEAQEHYQTARSIVKQIYGTKHEEFARSSNNLAYLFDLKGELDKAEQYYLEAKEIWGSINKNHVDYAAVCINLAGIYQQNNAFLEAEQLQLEGKQIYKQHLGDRHPDYARACNNLATTYEHLGFPLRALDLFRESKSIWEQVYGTENLSYASACLNIADVYFELHQFEKSESLYIEALTIKRKLLGKNHSGSIVVCQDLGALYIEMGKYHKSKKYLLEANANFKAKFGENHPKYASLCSNLASLYFKTKDYEKSINWNLKALDIIVANWGQEHSAYANICTNLVNTYDAMGHFDQANYYFNQAIGSYYDQINYLFAGLSENEKVAVFNKIKTDFSYFHYFILKNYQEHPEIIAKGFDLRINTKGLLLKAAQDMRQKIGTGNNKQLEEIFVEWKKKHNYLAGIYQMPKEQRPELTKVESLEEEIAELERKMAANTTVKTAIVGEKYHWQDVRDNLNQGEAAIEMVRLDLYPLSDIAKDSVCYLVYIVKPETGEHPELLVLHSGKEMEGKYLSRYHNFIENRIQDKSSYEVYWEPIAEYLQDISKVYISVDKAYHLININSLYSVKDASYVIDKLQLNLVSGMSELLQKVEKDPEPVSAQLFGDPDFYARIGVETLLPLPGTRTEVEAAAEILETAGVATKLFLGEQATETNLRNVQNPSVLICATHGKFNTVNSKYTHDQMMSEYVSMNVGRQMLHSALLLAGTGDKIDVNTDGELTALEAMSLNLDGTLLVVLSACESGLGKVESGEGIYGLQRAMQIAGARRVIMSKWKVDDKVTQELMTKFYKLWLLEKLEIHKAFREAQLFIRKKYEAPVLWASFVITGL